MSEVMFVGYWPSLHTDRQEYRDFMRLRQISREELITGCHLRIYPVGMVVEVAGRQFQILNGPRHQELWPLGRKPVCVRPQRKNPDSGHISPVGEGG